VISVEGGDSATGSLTETDSGLTDSGTLSVEDLDLSDEVDVRVDAVAASGTFGGVNPLSNGDLLAMLSVDSGNVIGDSATTGTINWSFDSDGEAFDFLAAGETLVLTYDVIANDGDTDSNTQTVTITITGTNDGPVASGSYEHQIVDGPGADTYDDITGQLRASDPDHEVDELTWTLPDGQGQYGTLTVNPDGSYTYEVDEAAVNGLTDGDNPVDSFTVVVTDPFGASDARTINISLSGTNDTAEVSGDDEGVVIEAGGGDPGVPTTEGTLLAVDADNPDNRFQPDSDRGSNGYGTFVVDEDGNWSYTLDNDNPEVDALNEGDTLTDTFVVRTEDGTEAQVTITIRGANDPAVIDGDDSGTVVEAGANGPGEPVAEGTLSSGDVDNPDNVFQPETGEGGSGYGNFVVDENGNWSYTLDNDNPEVAALNDGDTLTDTFVVRTEDGTETQVTITIRGANDPAVIGGDDTGLVVEDDAENTVGGTLTASDVDNPDNLFEPASGVSNGGYGSFVVDANGNWTYTLDNNNIAVDALYEGETLVDSFVISTADGTSRVVEITILGRDEPEVLHPVHIHRHDSGGDLWVPEVEGFDTGSSRPSGSFDRSLDFVANWLRESSEHEGVVARLWAALKPRDRLVYTSDPFTFNLQAGTFLHTDPGASLVLEATLKSGAPLPGWLYFDRETGEFSGIPPEGYEGEVHIRVVAKDSDGREAQVQFTIKVVDEQEVGMLLEETPQDDTSNEQTLRGKAGFSAQVAAEAGGNDLQAGARALVASLQALEN
jgi:VCBS repeat-containing protein